MAAQQHHGSACSREQWRWALPSLIDDCLASRHCGEHINAWCARSLSLAMYCVHQPAKNCCVLLRCIHAAWRVSTLKMPGSSKLKQYSFCPPRKLFRQTSQSVWGTAEVNWFVQHNLTEFKEHLDKALSHIIWFLCGPVLPRVGLWSLRVSFNSIYSNILW